MIEKGRISSLQMAILIYLTIIATGVLLVPSITGKYAHQDLWLSPIFASVAGFLVVVIACQLNRYYPKETIIQYSGKIVGRFPGKLIGLVFLFFYVHSNGIVLREYGEFVVGSFLPTTPLIVIIASMTLVSGMAVHGGLEVVARSAQIIVPVFVILFLVIVILLTPELDPKNVYPVLENGFMPSLMGSIVPSGWFAEFFLISFMLPFLKNEGKSLKYSVVTVIIVMLTLVLTNLVSLFLFGNITSKFTYPLMDATRYISIADFLQHIESIVMAIWVAGTFIKISVFYYAIVIGTAQWLRLSDYQPIVFPMGFVLAAFSIWSAPNLQTLSHFLGTTWPFYSLFLQLFIPLLLLLVAVIRKKASPRSR